MMRNASCLLAASKLNGIVADCSNLFTVRSAAKQRAENIELPIMKKKKSI